MIIINPSNLSEMEGSGSKERLVLEDTTEYGTKSDDDEEYEIVKPLQDVFTNIGWLLFITQF